jgi:hypothetical protein
MGTGKNIMKIEYLFTKSRHKKIGSKLISWSTGKLHPELKPCSHVAVKLGPIIIESTLKNGAQIQPYSEWIKHHEVVHAFKCPHERTAIKVIKDVFRNSWGKSYDYLGILYFAWRMLGFLVLKRPLPSVNRWQSKNKYFCVEMIEKITGQDYQMTSPIQLVSTWKKAKLEEIDIKHYSI